MKSYDLYRKKRLSRKVLQKAESNTIVWDISENKQPVRNAVFTHEKQATTVWVLQTCVHVCMYTNLLALDTFVNDLGGRFLIGEVASATASQVLQKTQNMEVRQKKHQWGKIDSIYLQRLQHQLARFWGNI